MKPVQKIRIIIAICLSQFFIQCTSDNNKGVEEKIVPEQYTDEVTMLRNFLAETLGIDIQEIKYNLERETFIISRDMLISLENARDRYNHVNSKITNKTNQKSTQYLVKPELASSFKLYIHPDVTQEWRVALYQAIDKWNKVNSSVSISVVDATNYTPYVTPKIKMIKADAKSSTIASAEMPYHDGSPGKIIDINSYYNSIDASKKLFAMTHELGHIFGLGHTNEIKPYYFHIPCTPLSSDENSVMETTVSTAWSNFNYHDIVAISTICPIETGTKKLYRYKKNQYYFYTTDPCEITPVKNGYIFDGDAGYLYSTQIPGTVPLYRILNGSTIKDHKLNKNKTSSNDVILGYLYSTQQPGTTALYSYGIYESKPRQTPSYMYHYNYTTTNSEAILKVIVGYVRNKTITKETPKYPILL